MIVFERHPARLQPALSTAPYDRWVISDGEVKAEFHRLPTGFLLRFPDEADFAIDPACGLASGWPSPTTSPDHFESLFKHAVVPLVGNHHGGLFLHGSAVAVDGRAVAFIGLSHSGKTTLAGAFSKAGYPFLTEDVIELVATDQGYLLQPKRSVLRLFVDSAAYLLGRKFSAAEEDNKHCLPGGVDLPFSDAACPLARIYLLGQDHAATLAITPLEGRTALIQLLPHAFVLDVEDKARVRGHFCRIAELSERIACHSLDYPRQYKALPTVIGAILNDLITNRNNT